MDSFHRRLIEVLYFLRLCITDCGMKRADVERFKFSNSLIGMFYDRLLGTVR